MVDLSESAARVRIIIDKSLSTRDDHQLDDLDLSMDELAESQGEYGGKV